MKILLVLGLLALVFVACQSQMNKGPEGSVLDAAAFQAKMTTLNNKILLDVRTPAEIAQGKIENAQELDFYGSNFDAELDKLDKTRPVMVYCKSGGRSGKAAAKLRAKGFTEVYDLKGGYSAWPK